MKKETNETLAEYQRAIDAMNALTHRELLELAKELSAMAGVDAYRRRHGREPRTEAEIQVACLAGILGAVAEIPKARKAADRADFYDPPFAFFA